MLIYHRQLTLDEGFAVTEIENKHSRLVCGKRVSRASGHALFTSLKERGEPLKCWSCGIEASSWIVNKGHKDLFGYAVLDLFASDKFGRPVLMTRDHIIPRSWGGTDDVQNLRVGCGPCNHSRGNHIEPEDQAFMDAHPELIHRGPDWKPPEMQTEMKGVKPEPSTEEFEARRLKRLVANRKRRAKHRARAKAKKLQLI